MYKVHGYEKGKDVPREYRTARDEFEEIMEDVNVWEKNYQRSNSTPNDAAVVVSGTTSDLIMSGAIVAGVVGTYACVMSVVCPVVVARGTRTAVDLSELYELAG